jgi:Zn-dependent protease with chaperone function
VFAAPTDSIKIKVLGTEDAPHLIVNLQLAERLSDTALVAAIAHELAHIQNGHILYATALHYLRYAAAFYVRWVVQPAIMTLQAWSRRAEVTCDRASLLAVRDLEKALQAMVQLEVGVDQGAAFSAEDYLRTAPGGASASSAPGGPGGKDGKRGLGRYGELFRSHPYVAKRVQALRLFAGSALYAQVTGGDPIGKLGLADIDKQVSDLISVL